jgi:transposase
MRATFAQRMLDELAPLADKLHFIDEIGTHLGLTRLYGRAAPGQRVVEATPGFSGPHYTSVAALNLRGVHAPFVFKGSMDGPAFETYVEHILGPDLVAGDIVLMDNLSPHKRAVIRSLIEARGATVEFLPPYSPDLNPIEKCWSKAKAFLRKIKARTFDELLTALAQALRSVSPRDAAAWFAHCGYAIKPSG